MKNRKKKREIVMKGGFVGLSKKKKESNKFVTPKKKTHCKSLEKLWQSIYDQNNKFKG